MANKVDLHDEYVVFGYIRQEYIEEMLTNSSFKTVATTSLLYFHLKDIFINNVEGAEIASHWTFGSIAIDLNHSYKYQQMIKINKLGKYNKCIIGITSDKNVNTLNHNLKHLFYGYDNSGFKLMNNSHTKCKYGISFGTDDLILIDINLKSKQIQFCVNGKDQGIAFNDVNNTKTYYLAIYLSSHNDKISIANKGIQQIQKCCNNYMEYKLHHKYDHLFVMISLNRTQSKYNINIPSEIMEIIYQYFRFWVVGDTVDVIDESGVWYKVQIIKHKLPSQPLESFKNHSKTQNLEGLYVHDIQKECIKPDQWIYIEANSFCECNELCKHHRITAPNNHQQSEIPSNIIKYKIEIIKRTNYYGRLQKVRHLVAAKKIEQNQQQYNNNNTPLSTNNYLDYQTYKLYGIEINVESKGNFKQIMMIRKHIFGDIKIVRHKKNNKVYAMCQMKIDKMIMKNQFTLSHIIYMIKNGGLRDLMRNDSSFLIKPQFALLEKDYYYLMTRFCGGGTLKGILMEKKVLNEEETRFYFAELSSAINHIHQIDVVLRDLKPEDILIGNDGHIKLVNDMEILNAFYKPNDQIIGEYEQKQNELKNEDYGDIDDLIAKYRNYRKLRNVQKGIVDYMAPEIFAYKGYDKMVDWWSMGVIMFECLMGYTPFYDENALEICRKIVNFTKYFNIPDNELSKTSVDLIKNLICSNRTRYGIVKIQKHLFFESILFDNILDMKPPFVPHLKRDDDTSYFDAIALEEFEDIQNVIHDD